MDTGGFRRRRADPVRARSTRVAPDRRRVAESTALFLERAPSPDRRRVEAAMSGLHDDAAPRVELPHHSCRHVAKS